MFFFFILNNLHLFIFKQNLQVAAQQHVLEIKLINRSHSFCIGIITDCIPCCWWLHVILHYSTFHLQTIYLH